MAYYEQFKKHIQENNLPTAVSLWQEYCMSDEVDPKEMCAILGEIKLAHFVESFGVYVEEGLPLWRDLPESSEKNEILKLIFDLETTDSAEYAEIALTYLKEKYGMIDIFSELLKITGLRDGETFKGCIRNFELLIHLQKGNFCFHAGSWGVGEVMDISFLRREISIEFENVSDTKEISFKNAFKILTPMKSDHFLARRFGNPEKFEAFTRQNPLDTIKLLLKDLGDSTAFEIREEMEALIIPEEEWAKWWSSVRGKLKKDTEIVYPGSLKVPFKLNTMKETQEDRLKTAIESVKSIKEMIDILYIFLRDFSVIAKEATLNAFLRAELGGVLFNKNITVAEEIQILFLLSDLNDSQGENIEGSVRKLSRVPEIIESIKILSYKRRLLSVIRKVREDWLELFCDLVVSKKKHSLRDFLYDEIILSKQEDSLSIRIEEMLKYPATYPNAFLWFFQKIMKKKTTLFMDQDSLNKSFEAFFVLMYHVEVELKDRMLTKKMHAMLTDKRFEIVRRIFKGSSKEVIRELLLLSTKCQVLTSHDKSVLYSLAAVVYPDLAQNNIDKEEEIIWSTLEGLKKVTDRIEQIATKEVIENAKDIEIARAHGDLRENSEYKFAQEKRASLQKEMKTLSGQIKKARVLSKDDIDTSSVSVGTKVRIVDLEGIEKQYVILGPFDADTENDIISAQSKLAKYLLDKKVGEKVIFNDNTWEVKEITQAI
jgi:transcription elongation factor GreA-like protein/transcription elongation GreA/GreB family factor